MRWVIHVIRISTSYSKESKKDQATVKGVYTDEANEELAEYMNSKQNFITFGAEASREICDDIVQSVFAITKVLSTQNLTQNISFS